MKVSSSSLKRRGECKFDDVILNKTERALLTVFSDLFGPIALIQ